MEHRPLCWASPQPTLLNFTPECQLKDRCSLSQHTGQAPTPPNPRLPCTSPESRSVSSDSPLLDFFVRWGLFICFYLAARGQAFCLLFVSLTPFYTLTSQIQNSREPASLVLVSCIISYLLIGYTALECRGKAPKPKSQLPEALSFPIRMKGSPDIQ